MALRGMPSYLAVTGFLGEGDAAFRLDVFHPGGAVRSGARKDDADGTALSLFRQGAHKEIDGQMLARSFAAAA